MDIKFSKYEKNDEKKKQESSFTFVCSCHDSMEEHFEQIIKEDGKDVAKFVFNSFLQNYLNTQKKLASLCLKNF